MFRRMVVGGIAAALLLSGIGVAAAAEFTKTPACDLVAGEAVEAAFGVVPTSTTPQDEKGKFTTCTWILAGVAPDTDIAFVGIDKPNSVNKKDFKANSKNDAAEKVPGIKKGFYLLEDNAGTVTFIKNGNFVNVQYLGDAPDEVEANKAALIDFATGVYGDL
jgi:hypothetical protein